MRNLRVGDKIRILKSHPWSSGLIRGEIVTVTGVSDVGAQCDNHWWVAASYKRYVGILEIVKKPNLKLKRIVL